MEDRRLPRGIVERKKSGGGFGGRFASTIMGTALFVAEMQRRVPLRTKLLVLAIVALGAGLGGWAYWRARQREHNRAELQAALASPPDRGVIAVRGLLGRPLDDEALARAYAYLGRAGDAASVPALVEGLSGPPDVRRAAAAALARIGAPAALPAIEPLSRMMASGDPPDVYAAAWALARLGQPAGISACVEGLARGTLASVDGFDQALLAQSLGRDGLARLLGHEAPAVRAFAARWLAGHCESVPVAELARVARDPDESTALAASVTLARCGGPTELAAVAAVAAERPALVEPMYRAFALQVGAPGIAAIWPALPERVHDAALEALVASADPRTAQVLPIERVLGSSPPAARRILVGRALLEWGDARGLEVLDPLFAASGPEAQAAVEALAASPEPTFVEPVLLSLATRRSDLRLAVLRAAGRVGACGERARVLYQGLGQAPPTMGEALAALARCGRHEAAAPALARHTRPGGEHDRLDVTEGALRLALLDAVARLRPPEAGEPLLGLVTAPSTHGRLRLAAAHALGAVADDAVLERVADRMLDASTPPAIRRALAVALLHRAPPGAMGRLLGYLRSGDEDERTRAAVAAVALSAGPDLADELRRLLDDERARAHAAVAVAWGGDEAGARRLGDVVASDPRFGATVRARIRETELPIESAMLRDGRLTRRLVQALRVRDAGVGDAWQHLTAALGRDHEEPGGASALEIRRWLAAALDDPHDAETRRMAAEALLAIGARGILLAARAARGPGAAEAAAVLDAADSSGARRGTVALTGAEAGAS
ncbi:MAG: HEAT repeat domain-containing protein [Myxococcota bacterium]|nr:HEAT repeat domain-containing protein [Myxococcota bacterium]